MISVDMAIDLIKENSLKTKEEKISLGLLVGRILSRPLLAARDQPPFDRVAMDGIALSFDKASLSSSIKLEGIQSAGRPGMSLSNPANAIEVMTGAVLPIGTTTVIPYEKIEIDEGHAKIDAEYEVRDKKNIHFYKSDYAKGIELLKAGTRLSSASVALIAGQGYQEVMVYQLPKMAIISTGDELIEPGNKCEDWQIWRSNPFGLYSELSSLGYDNERAELFHLSDNESEMKKVLQYILDHFEVVVLSGGISMGKYDFVEKVLLDLKVKKIFHKIKQKPGKPMYFGVGGRGQLIFALPGNPSAALICFRRFVIPSLIKALGGKVKEQYAVLDEVITYEKDFTFFKAVTVQFNKEGRLVATPIKSNGSGDFLGLGKSDGFLELPAIDKVYPKGSAFQFIPWSVFS
jgi:molybdopterin molybdotransferase